MRPLRQSFNSGTVHPLVVNVLRGNAEEAPTTGPLHSAMADAAHSQPLKRTRPVPWSLVGGVTTFKRTQLRRQEHRAIVDEHKLNERRFTASLRGITNRAKKEKESLAANSEKVLKSGVASVAKYSMDLLLLQERAQKGRAKQRALDAKARRLERSHAAAIAELERR